MKCEKCNTELNLNSNFCPSCGKKINQPSIKFSSLLITSTKDGQSVVINGEKTQISTPCNIEILKPGRYIISVESESFYSDQKTIVIQGLDPIEIDFLLQEYVNCKISTKHDLLSFYLGNKQIISNQTVKVKHGNYDLSPSIKSFPNINLEIPFGAKEFVFDYDELIIYSTISFQNFPDKIHIYLSSKETGEKDSFSLKPINETKYIHSAKIETTSSESNLKLIDGVYDQIKWSCKSYKGKLELSALEEQTNISFKDNLKKVRKKKKSIIFGSVALILISLIFIVGPFVYEALYWNKTKKLNSINDYKSYIETYKKNSFTYNSYPFSEMYYNHGYEATQEIDLLRWNLAQNENSVHSYQIYIRNSEYGCSMRSDAIYRIDSICNVTNRLFDKRDERIYSTVKIGEQIWMAENLNYEKAGWVNTNIPARFYSHREALYICPEGWHLPSDDEWKKLELYLGMSDGEVEKKKGFRGTIQGSMLKSSTLWKNGGDGINESGFNALPYGIRSNNGKFLGIGDYASFWTSTWDNYSGLCFRYLSADNSGIGRDYITTAYMTNIGYCVRCLKD